MNSVSRRGFIRSAAALVSAALPVPPPAEAAVATTPPPGSIEPMVMTVTGPVRVLGLTLSHEHVTTDFLGAEKLLTPRYDRDTALAAIRPHFEALARRGVRTLVECTPAHIGRDVRLLRLLSKATGVQVITNTGYYGAVDNKYLPKHAFDETVEQLADRWMMEARAGIEGTGIRPGFLKLGTGKGPLPELHVKLLRAACRVHRVTGLTIAVHTGDGIAARDELRILEQEGIAPSALIWVHAQNDAGPIQVELARRGAWISLDGFNLAQRNPERYVNMLGTLRSEGLLGRVLISHDDGWAVEGEWPYDSPLKLFSNGNPVPYVSIFERLIPDLRTAGFTEGDVRQLTVTNPVEAFALRRRLA